MKLYAILLIFYDEHQENSINSFTQFLNEMNIDFELIVVSNSSKNHADTNVIRGDNTNWEFTGWDKGLSQIEDIKESDVVLFANDTFSFRRKWRQTEQVRFRRSINKLLKSNKQGICGEIHNFNELFHLFGMPSNYWVCTYFFALTGGLIKDLKKLSIDEDILSSTVIDVENNANIIWGSGVSENLKVRIQQWLFPSPGMVGWYKASVATEEVKLRKAKTIINEKYLTAYCLSKGAYLIDAGPCFFIKMSNRIKDKIIMLLKSQMGIFKK